LVAAKPLNARGESFVSLKRGPAESHDFLLPISCFEFRVFLQSWPCRENMGMTLVWAAAAVVLIVVVFIDAFEVVILPRRVRHGYRLASVFYRSAWVLWRAAARLLPAGSWRQGFLSVFGPLSLFGLMSLWAVGLIFGFALLHWSLDTALALPRDTDINFVTYLYFSGTTFFTLGYGDLVPTGTWGRAMSVAEAGIGFGFLAVVISYLPVLYQAFSRREIAISLLDARAGSPPSAGELLRRLAEARTLASAGPLLIEWERWAAELLESHLSFPVLRFYRSQHDNQSWVGALTTILDTSAILIAGVDSADGHQARLTFAMARHAAVDLGLVTRTAPLPPAADRLPPQDLAALWQSLRRAGLPMRDEPAVAKALTELRSLYEPFVNALAVQLMFALPAFQPLKPPVDNWQTSPWMPCSPGLGGLPAANAEDEHVG
jgi:Ion channel